MADGKITDDGKIRSGRSLLEDDPAAARLPGPGHGPAVHGQAHDAKTVFWNNPTGVYEVPSFADGTRTIALALTSSDAFTMIGGGDTAAAVRTLGFADRQFGHVSTEAGARPGRRPLVLLIEGVRP